MKAARLFEGSDRLQLVEVPVPEPRADAVLVRVAGAGVCHSDLHVLDGMFAETMRLPVTMGHEIAGWVEAVGPDARGVEVGEPVVVMVGWGCGHCEWCVSGHEQLCPQGDEAGATADGGFAEFVLVPHRRHVVSLGALDPVESTPFGCAALCSYAAIRRVQPVLEGGSTLAVIGIGGLGQYGVQFARLLTGARVIAVDRSPDRLERARELGADHGVCVGSGAADEILVTAAGGVDGVIDFVGDDGSLELAARIVGRGGIVALLGLAGGSVPFSFTALAPEATLTTVVAGTIRDLQQVVQIAQAHHLESHVSTYPLDDVNNALDDLRAGRVSGRAALVPEGGNR